MMKLFTQRFADLQEGLRMGLPSSCDGARKIATYMKKIVTENSPKNDSKHG